MEILPIFIPHLGCPNHCVFCNQHAIAAPAVPTQAEVTAQIRQGLCYSKCPEIAYYGGSFTAIGRTLMEQYLVVAQGFVTAGKAQGIRISTRPDCIDEGVLSLLKQYGVTTIELGAQSMVDEVLEASKRGHSARDVIQSVELIRKRGFQLGLQLMAGLPGDSLAFSLYSTVQVCKLAPDFVRIYPVCVIKDTELEQMTRQGTYMPLTVEQAVETAAQMMALFEQHNIPIIRIGLNPTQELSAGAVVAGAYHPALGEQVRSRVMNKKIREQLSKLNLTSIKNIVILSNPRDASVIRGQKNAEYQRLQQEFPGVSIGIQAAQQIPRGQFKILSL